MNIMGLDIKTENIGPTHPNFNHKFPDWTQVLVKNNGIVIAQFFGITAKIMAQKFVSSFSSL